VLTSWNPGRSPRENRQLGCRSLIPPSPRNCPSQVHRIAAVDRLQPYLPATICRTSCLDNPGHHCADSTHIRFSVAASRVPSNLRQESNAPGCRNGARQAGAVGRSMVADIAKLSVGREDCYVREVAGNREEYLSGHGESPGRWLGRAARALDQEGYRQHGGVRPRLPRPPPDTGELLGRPHGEHGVPAFDVVLRPTKSVSLLYGLGDAKVAAQVLEAWRQSVRAVEDCRQRFQINDPQGALGEPPARDHHDPRASRPGGWPATRSGACKPANSASRSSTSSARFTATQHRVPSGVSPTRMASSSTADTPAPATHRRSRVRSGKPANPKGGPDGPPARPLAPRPRS
jgi:TrwC relaxase